MLKSGIKKEDPEKIKESFDILKLTSSRIRKMVLDILYYAKERELELEPVDVLKFAQTIADVIRPKIKNHPINFVQYVDHALLKVEMDADFLRSALVNILDNAVDACLEDDSKTSHNIIFRVKNHAEDMVIEIHDDGVGMDTETMDNLFKLFFSSKGGKGTGFGLYISNNIINQHGGSINVDSVKGKGSRFTITIPKQHNKNQK